MKWFCYNSGLNTSMSMQILACGQRPSCPPIRNIESNVICWLFLPRRNRRNRLRCIYRLSKWITNIRTWLLQTISAQIWVWCNTNIAILGVICNSPRFRLDMIPVFLANCRDVEVWKSMKTIWSVYDQNYAGTANIVLFVDTF